MATIAELLKKYAKTYHISVARMERELGWKKDTIRKMTLATDKNKARIRILADRYRNVFEVCPELKEILEDSGGMPKFCDERVEILEALLSSKEEIITLLREENRLLREFYESHHSQTNIKQT